MPFAILSKKDSARFGLLEKSAFAYIHIELHPVR